MNATTIAPRTNSYPGTCPTCRKNVAPQAGFIRKEGGHWVTYCREHYPERIAPAGPVVRELTADGRVLTPREPENLPLVKAMPGARFDPTGPCWRVSLAQEDRPRLLELSDRLGLDVAPELRAVERTEREVAAVDAATALGLYPFQVEGVAFLARHPRALLGDDMGLGKTVQTLRAVPAAGGAIVVCPASLKFNWRDECDRWRPDLRPTVLAGKGRLRRPDPGEVLIVNYDVLPDAKDVPAGLGDVTLIVDEAHAVKNAKALRHKRVKALSAACGRVWFLTGTPLLTRPPDLYGVLEAGGMAEAAFGHFGRFFKLFNAYKDGYGTVWGSPRPEVPEMLRRVMLRRRRTEVLPDLPRKVYSELAVNGLSAGLRHRLDAFWDERGDVLEVDDSLPPFEEFSALRAALAAERVPALLEIVADHEEQEVPLVVFSAHRAPVEALSGRDGWATILGDTTPEERQDAVRRFQAGELKGIALTIAAGGVGLTLTRAWKVLFVDLDWTPALNAQAEDRICRIGQTAGSCEVVRMVSDHPLERHVHRLIARKIDLVNGAVEDTVSAVVPARVSAEQGETEAEYRDRLARAAETVAAREAAERGDAEAARRLRAKGRVGGILARLSERYALPAWPLSPERAEQVRGAVRYLASVCDGAEMRDGAGFNKPDAGTGHVLACTGLETEDELRATWLLVWKYRGQCRDRFPLLWSEG